MALSAAHKRKISEALKRRNRFRQKRNLARVRRRGGFSQFTTKKGRLPLRPPDLSGRKWGDPEYGNDPPVNKKPIRRKAPIRRRKRR